MFSGVIFYGNMKDLTLQKQSQQKKGYVYSSDTLVITAKSETYTALFPHSGNCISIQVYNVKNLI